MFPQPLPFFSCWWMCTPATYIASYSLARVRQVQSEHLHSAQTGTVEEGVKSVKKWNKKFWTPRRKDDATLLINSKPH